MVYTEGRVHVEGYEQDIMVVRKMVVTFVGLGPTPNGIGISLDISLTS